MTRRDIAFDAAGTTLRGWFYPAEGASGPGAAVVMAHGFSAVKEMYLDRFAEVFAAAGLNVLVFDNRCFGASDGEPRQEIDPWAQVRDYRHAITYAGTLPETDANRIGIWGSSYSGGHVLVLGAIDRRVKAVVSQVPLISGHDNFRALVRADFIAGFREMFDDDRLARFRGEPPVMVPVVDEDPLAPSALPTADSYTWFTETGKSRAPSPCTQTAGEGFGSAAVSFSSISLAQRIRAGATSSMQWVSERPKRLVFSCATTTPTRVRPSQQARYSGVLGISRQTTSPRERPCSSAQRAYRFACAASPR